MKKAVLKITGMAVVALATVGCGMTAGGSGHKCDAYGELRYLEYKDKVAHQELHLSQDRADSPVN